MVCKKQILPMVYLWLLVFSTIFFSVSLVSAQSLSDDEWMKQRLARIHARYTGVADHDQFLYKLQQAEKNATSVDVRDALSQIIVWREELRPATVRSWISSIPTQFVTQTTVTKNTPDTDEQDIAESELIPVPSSTSPVLPVVTHDRYQLDVWFIDIAMLQETRLQWVNELRVSRGRQQLSLHPLLHKTAADRSETMHHKGIADHRRFAHSAYYSYGELENRFADRWIQFVNVSRATFTENIGRSSFRCSQEDCTQKAIDAMRQTFEFYLREEGTKNDAHRRTMIHPLFQIVWLWISVDESTRKFYLTTHYGTQIK
jgi:uncharacterized protein YkwD